jgi:hypothetical protein
VTAQELPADLVRQPERAQQVLEANALGGARTSPLAERIEIGVGRHHAGREETPQAPQAALESGDDIGTGLV